MEEPIKIIYSFRFDDGSEKVFDIALDRSSLGFLPKEHPSPPSWTELDNNRCENCALDPASNRHCPIALNLSDIVESFKDYFSYENVSVMVTTEDRRYAKDTSLQEGLGAMIGIVMVTSGCPAMEKMKPMVRFHLPFANLQEVIFRTVSMYLMAQYFLNREGRPADWELAGVEGIYSQAGIVNRDFAKRLLQAAKKDANINALVGLDCFASMAALNADEALNEIKLYFSAYLR